MRASTLTQVPYPNSPGTITANQLPLIRVDDNVVDRSLVRVIPLNGPRPGVPNLDGTILGASDHPFSLAMECNTSDIVGMALEGHHRACARCRLYIIEFDVQTACRCDISFVWGNAQPIHLRVWVLNGSRADARKSLPETIIEWSDQYSDRFVALLLTELYGHIPLYREQAID